MSKLKPLVPNAQGVADRLRRYREARMLQQGEFARIIGVAHNTYNQWESAKRIPELTTGMALCEIMGVTLDWLYRGQFHGLPTPTAELLSGLRRPPEAKEPGSAKPASKPRKAA